MRNYGKMIFVMILGTLMSQSLMAEVIHPIDYPFNPTAEKNPFHLTFSAQTRKKFNMSKGAIRTAMKNSPDWANMDERIRSKISKNMKNFYQLHWDYLSLYWDKEKGISIVATVKQPSRIYLNRTRFNGPEDMAFEFSRTQPINAKTKRPYFELTPELLVKLEEETGTQLTQEQKNWLSDYASVLNENFHYFYGESFFAFQDVIGEVDKSELIGRFYPNKLFLKEEQELFVPTVDQERNFLYLKLIATMSEQKQAEVLKMLIGLPQNKEERETLLNDTERLLTEYGMKKHEKTVTKIVKELKKNNLDDRKEQILLNKLFSIIEKSRFKYVLYSRYMQTSTDTLEQIMPYVSDRNQKLAEQVRHDLERVDEIHANKKKIGAVIGRPLYHYDKVMKDFSVDSSNCVGQGESRILLPGKVYDMVPYANATRREIVMVLNARASHYSKIFDCFVDMMNDVYHFAQEKGADMDALQNNDTAFEKAVYLLSAQAIGACHQIVNDDYTKVVASHNNVKYDDARSLAEKIKLKPFNAHSVIRNKIPNQGKTKELQR